MTLPILTSRIAAYQGNVVVPLFLAPYVYPDAIATGNGVAMTGVGGDQAMAARIKGNGGFIQTQTNVAAGTVDLFTPASFSRLTVNGGSNNPNVSGIAAGQPGIMCGNNWRYGDLFFYINNNTEAHFVAYNLGQVPFYKNTSLPAGIGDLGSNNTVGLNPPIGNMEPLMTNNSCQRACINVSANGIDLGESFLGNMICGADGLSIALQYGVWFPQALSNINASAYIFVSDTSNTVEPTAQWVFPNFNTRQNILWYSKSGFLAYRAVNIVYDPANGGLEQPTFSDSIFALLTDNAQLNADIASPGTVVSYAMANFMYLIDENTNIDYVVSPDGSKYWSLTYESFAPGYAVPKSMGGQGSNPFYIDQGGAAYFTGNLTNTGGFVQPLISVGFNFPFNQIGIPAIPPIPMPCWNACLGRVGGAPGQLFLN